jgi:hypothetical protein
MVNHSLLIASHSYEYEASNERVNDITVTVQYEYRSGTGSDSARHM